MFKDLKNHELFNFFEENRLVFIQEAPRKKRPGKSPKQIREETADRLAKLHSEDLFGIEEDEKKPGLATHTDKQRHTRETYEPKPYYQESVDTARRAVALSGRREARETALIQGVHENLYTQYMNPGFMMYLHAQPGKLLEKLYPVLDLIMKHPDDFEYVSKGGEILHIIKKKPYKGRPKAIDDNFLVVMEGGEGNITRVQNGSFDAELKEKGKIPWVSNDSFNKKLPLYNKMWSSAQKAHATAAGYSDWYFNDGTVSGFAALQKRTFESMAKEEHELKELYVAMNILFLQRFTDLIAARGLQWEGEDAGIQVVVDAQKKQGKTFEDITVHGRGEGGQLFAVVLADPNVEGLYLIHTSSTRRNPIRVNLKGQVMRRAADGSWKPDVRYTDNVRRNYYYREDKGANKDLLTADTELTDEEKKRMADAEGEDTPPRKNDSAEERAKDSETVKEVERMYALIEEREKVDVVLFKEKDAELLQRIMIYLLPTQKKGELAMEYIANFGNRKKRQWLRNGIKRTLDNEDVPKVDGNRNRKVGEMLGIAWPDEKKWENPDKKK